MMFDLFQFKFYNCNNLYIFYYHSKVLLVSVKEFEKMKNEKLKKIRKILRGKWWQINESLNFSNNIIDNFSIFCSKIPKSLKNLIFYLIESSIILSYTIFCLKGDLYLSIYLINGEEKYSKKKIKIIYLGNQNENLFIWDNLFLYPPKIKKIGKLPLLKLKKKLYDIIKDKDAIFIKSHSFYSKFFEKKGFISIPEWVSTELETSLSFDKIENKFTGSGKEDIRKIKKNCFSYCMDSRIETFKTFYKDMYLPYLSWRYSKSAEYASYSAMLYLFIRNSRLMLIKSKNDLIAGSLFSVKNKVATATCTGILKDKFEYFKKGASSASYYFLIKWAKDNCIEKVNFGKCRPFINNGLLVYKLKWGTSVKRPKDPFLNTISFLPLRESEAMLSFLLNNPLILSNKKRLIGLRFQQENICYSNNNFENNKKHNVPGLERIETTCPRQFICECKEKFKLN